MSNKKRSLSKSTLIRSIQCPKSLYLYKNNYALRDKPNTVQQQRFDRGHRVGKLAHQLFPEGKDCSPPNPYSYDASVAATKLLIQQKFNTIFEAAFKHNGILVALDILNYKDGKWYAYEVKSSLKISNTYLLDAAIQYYIITQSGIELEDFFIITINNEYILEDDLEVAKYFKKTSVLEAIKERIPYVETTIQDAIKVLDAPQMPDVPIGVHCAKPYTCDFQGYCWKDIPKNSIWYLPGISMQEKSTWSESGINTVIEITNTDELNSRQKVIVEAYKKQKVHLVFDLLKTFMDNLQYPFYYFDIEAFQPAVPIFKGTKPYERIPFLYSLHYKENKESALIHNSYISPIGNDDRQNFIVHFLEATQGEGQILVFNTLMEKGILFKMINDFPQHQVAIQNRINRIVDIEIPFKELYYYHPAQQGSFSLKAIGNAMFGVDEFSVGKIKDGEEAMAVYNELFYLEDKEEVQQKLNDLQRYCHTDTYVLSKIVEKLMLLNQQVEK